MLNPYLSDLEVAKRWLQAKGVSVWPSLPDADTTRDSEAEALAKWFLDQAADLNEFASNLEVNVKTKV